MKIKPILTTNYCGQSSDIGLIGEYNRFSLVFDIGADGQPVNKVVETEPVILPIVEDVNRNDKNRSEK